ncbi:TPA: hypothetical protein ACHU8I_000590 [Streptococcus suis]|nr:hypothetical protein [Streptococcus suis]QBX21203.1 hypothetical protein Javan565_0028 [Streptococcus phage Javan565]MCV6616623.1 hypothetical protein [Streptococcus suis]MCV6618388.1 hypothetical protein [Streptococcus suis]MCV6632594.1 hypothetical protein [Streptococcus suis]MCV6634804.1 hypothetical protein [Streptococcus suis]
MQSRKDKHRRKELDKSELIKLAIAVAGMIKTVLELIKLIF